MPSINLERLRNVAKLLACALIVKVTASVVLGYRDYMPPNFDSGFLQGRQSYFSASYQWAFYAHITSGPCALIFGIILLSERIRKRFSNWHRFLGRIEIGCVLLLVVPSGMWMAFYADSGAVASVGFVTLAGVTGLCAWFGWRSAVRRRFTDHRRWMLRCFLLLCSAVTLRLMGGVITIVGIYADWTYAVSAWLSWLVPLGAFELIRSGSESSNSGVEHRPQPSG